VSDPVTYTAVLPVAEETVQFVSALSWGLKDGVGPSRWQSMV
jgi:hypothetical protein